MCQINYIIDSLSPNAFPMRKFWDLLIQMAELLYQSSGPSPLNSVTPTVLWDSNSEKPTMREDMRLVVSALEKLGPRVKSIQSNGNSIHLSLSDDSTAASTPDLDQVENLNNVSGTSNNNSIFGTNQNIINNSRKNTTSNISWDIPSSRLQEKSYLDHSGSSFSHSSSEISEESCCSEVSPLDLTMNSPAREKPHTLLYEESEITILEPRRTNHILNENITSQVISPNVENDVINLTDLSKQQPRISDKTSSILTFSTLESVTNPDPRISRRSLTQPSPVNPFPVPETIPSPALQILRRIPDKATPFHPFSNRETISRPAPPIASMKRTENFSTTSNMSNVLGRTMCNDERESPTPSRPIRYSSPFIANTQLVVTDPSVSTRSGRTRKVKRCSCCSPDIFSQNANFGENGGPANKRNKGRNNFFLIM